MNEREQHYEDVTACIKLFREPFLKENEVEKPTG